MNGKRDEESNDATNGLALELILMHDEREAHPSSRELK